MEKYGFVYIWYDRKHKRYYVGSHWGYEDDGYVCSSPWMMQAYKKRTSDFRRRILSRVHNDRKTLLDEEFKWLSLIKEDEIKTRYYNLKIRSTGHWIAYSENVKSVKDKIAIKTKEAMQRDDVRDTYLKGLETRDTKSSDPKVRAKRSASMKKTMAEKFPVENRKVALTDEERSEYYSNKSKIMHANRTEEQRLEINRKISEANKRNVRPNIICPHCNKEGGYIAMKRHHFDNCKSVKSLVEV